ncbi:DUF1015 family protein [Nonomuraea sp. NPDC050383]|uniref:DUF1015 family protein n=1 Tax=Nonomuraea sp. NPDC050383 TaxID=3364362 RepID=UPI0037B73F59
MGSPELPVPDGLVLRPFRGVRFAVDDPAKVTSPPYDLIADDDVRALLDSHPNNVVRLILPRPTTPAEPTNARRNADAVPVAGGGGLGSPESTEVGAPTDLNDAGDGQPATASDIDETRYAEARDTLRAWLEAGILTTDALPALYVYEQRGPGILQRGLIGDVGIADPTQGIILPHEHVFPGPVADRLALMSTTQANLEPIFLLYDGGDGQATRLVDEVATTREPLVAAHTEDGLTHRLWAITDATEIAAVNADLRPRQALIADGHHRYATYRVLQRQEHTARTQTPPAHPANLTATDTSASPLNDAIASSLQADTTSSADQADMTSPRTDSTSSPRTDTTTFGRTDPASFGRSDTTSFSRTDPASFGRGTGTSSVTADAPQARETSTARPESGPWDFGLALLVDVSAYPPDLKAIHRVIPALPLAEAAARAKGAWRVHDYPSLTEGLAALDATSGPAFLLAGEGGTHLLTDPDPMQLAHAMPADRSDRWNALNTSILTEFLMPKVWDMQDDEQTVRIVHHDARSAAEQAARAGGTAVILKPLAVADVLAVAAAGERVPRKSTSFGPKPRTGLILRTFATD